MQKYAYFKGQESSSQALDKVFFYVLDKINSRQLLPGDTLYETSLASELDLSRTPVRQALTKLVGEGFLETPRGKRGYHVPELTYEDMGEVFQMREMLEGKAAELAAQQAKMEDVIYLRRLNEEEKKCSLEKQIHTYHKINTEFHFTVVRIGNNRYLERSYHPVFWRSMLYVFFLGEFHPLESDTPEVLANNPNSPWEHHQITEAIARREGLQAKELAAAHLRSTRAYRISLESSRASLLLQQSFKK